MKTTVVECYICSKPVSKPTKEVKRRLKEGHIKFYCNNSCSIHDIPSMKDGTGSKSKVTEFSPFKYFISKIKKKPDAKRNYYGPSDLTCENLKELWDAQRGICPYTGYSMELPINTTRLGVKNLTKRASLDRIDSSKGYIQGNVEFVCLPVNLGKSSSSKEKMLEFFQPLRDANTASLPVLTVA